MLSHNQVMTLFDQMNISFEAGRCSRNFQLQMNFKYFLGNLARNKLSVLMYTCLKLLLASNKLNTFNCNKHVTKTLASPTLNELIIVQDTIIWIAFFSTIARSFF